MPGKGQSRQFVGDLKWSSFDGRGIKLWLISPSSLDCSDADGTVLHEQEYS